MLLLVEKSLADPQVPKSYGILRTAAWLLRERDTERAIVLLQQAKSMLPRVNKEDIVEGRKQGGSRSRQILQDKTQVAWYYDTLSQLLVRSGQKQMEQANGLPAVTPYGSSYSANRQVLADTQRRVGKAGIENTRLAEAIALQQERVKATGTGQAELLTLTSTSTAKRNRSTTPSSSNQVGTTVTNKSMSSASTNVTLSATALSAPQAQALDQSAIASLLTIDADEEEINRAASALRVQFLHSRRRSDAEDGAVTGGDVEAAQIAVDLLRYYLQAKRERTLEEELKARYTLGSSLWDLGRIQEARTALDLNYLRDSLRTKEGQPLGATPPTSKCSIIDREDTRNSATKALSSLKKKTKNHPFSTLH